MHAHSHLGCTAVIRFLNLKQTFAYLWHDNDSIQLMTWLLALCRQEMCVLMPAKSLSLSLKLDSLSLSSSLDSKSLSSSLKSLTTTLAITPLMWNIAKHFVPSSGYCGILPALYTVDQRRILFYKKLIHHSSILIRTIARLCQYDIVSVAAKYGIYRLDNSVSFIKKSVWKTFPVSVV